MDEPHNVYFKRKYISYQVYVFYVSMHYNIEGLVEWKLT